MAVSWRLVRGVFVRSLTFLQDGFNESLPYCSRRTKHKNSSGHVGSLDAMKATCIIDNRGRMKVLLAPVRFMSMRSACKVNMVKVVTHA